MNSDGVDAELTEGDASELDDAAAMLMDAIGCDAIVTAGVDAAGVGGGINGDGDADGMTVSSAPMPDEMFGSSKTENGFDVSIGLTSLNETTSCSCHHSDPVRSALCSSSTDLSPCIH